MHAMTAANLRNAHGGESMANMRYLVWSDCAEKEGYASVARLFRAVAFAETVHAGNHFRALKDEAGDLPDKCPICGAPRKDFRTFA